ncbi:MAG: site-2 protease family protein [Terriglobales bacterium]
MPEFLPPVSSSSTTDYYRPVEVFVVQPPKQRYWLHVVLLLATIFTTLVVGARMEFNFLHNQPFFYTSDDSITSVFPLTWALQGSNILLGIPFSLTLMLILMAHEMGHYLYCRHYGVSATLPFFIPFPSLFGTMGAFIRIRSPIRSRAALFDIGVAGPIAGFSTALVVLLLALPLSKTVLPSAVAPEIQLQYPLIFRLIWAMLPRGGSTLDAVYLHPAAVAAWVGMFATALNLLPGGQLDGGHIVFSLAPRAHKTVSRLTILALIPMALYFWAGWLIWAVLLRISGMRHPMVAEWPGVTGARRWIAGFALVMLILTLAPSPFGPHGSLLEFLQALQDYLHQLRS